MRTPIFEHSHVFIRPLGEDSEVVSKQMYLFADRSGQPMVLRPENTAGIVRAFVSRGDYSHLPFKTFYSGPMFRYEHPHRYLFPKKCIQLVYSYVHLGLVLDSFTNLGWKFLVVPFLQWKLRLFKWLLCYCGMYSS